MDNDLKALFDASQETHAPRVINVDPTEAPFEAPVLVVPKGMQALDVSAFVEKFRPLPQRRKGAATLETLTSFIAHANRFKDEDSAIFADPNREHPRLVSVLDYSEKGAAGRARWGTHRGVYTFPIAEQWETWTNADGVEMSQATFAQFIEDNIADILDPSLAGDPALDFAARVSTTLGAPARIMELSRGLQVNVDRRVANATNLSTGEGRLLFEEQHTDKTGAPLNVPGAFLIGVQVFRSGALYQVPVRLRFRVKGGSIVWFVELYRTDLVFDHAFKEACDEAEKGTSLPLYVGTPEA